MIGLPDGEKIMTIC